MEHKDVGLDMRPPSSVAAVHDPKRDERDGIDSGQRS